MTSYSPGPSPAGLRSRTRRCGSAGPGAVAFVNVAKHGTQPPGSPELWELMWTAARNNVHSPERFMQTSVGWLVRELGRADQDAALAFLAEHRALLSREAARYIVEKLPADVQAAALAG